MKNAQLASFAALLAAFSLVALGCQSEIIGGGGSGGDQSTTTGGNQDTTTGTTGGNQGDGGGPVVDPPPSVSGPALAMLYSQLPNSSFGSGSAVSSTGTGSGLDPNTLMIFVGNESRSCADPYQDIASCGAPRYTVTVALPPNLQAVGSYPLQNLATFGESGSNGQPGDCWGGGGTYWDGTIEVTAIDAQSVTFTLIGTESLYQIPGVTNADGTYTAPRCP